MVREGDGIRTARLMRIGLIGAIGLGLFLVVFVRYRDYRKNLRQKGAALVARERILAADSLQKINQLPDLDSSPLDPVLKLASDAVANMRANVFDYTATLEKQERVGGELGESQTIKLKIMTRSPRPNSTEDHPLHAYFLFASPESVKGREVIWVEGKNNNNLIAHEAGIFGFVRANLPPNGIVAMRGNKYPASQVGIENLLRKLIEKGLRDREIPTCQVTIDDQYAWENLTLSKIVVVHPEPISGVDFHRAEILIDRARQIPLSYASYSWPKSPDEEPPLEERYVYRDVQLNVGLTEEDFDPDNPAYNYP